MALFSPGIHRAITGKTNPKLVEELMAKQPRPIPYEIRDKGERNWVVDFDGSIEIRQSDLEKGKLPFKIGRLTGDLICYCRQFNPSLIPDELGGKVIFKHPRLGARTRISRFKIEDKVYCLSKNKSAYNKVKRIIFTSCYADDLTIVEDIRYVVGDYVEETVRESETFASEKELKEWLSNPRGVERAQPNGQKVTTLYTVGDDVWFMKDNKPTRQTIYGVEVVVNGVANFDDAGEFVSKDERYTVKFGEETLILKPVQMYETRSALVNSF